MSTEDELFMDIAEDDARTIEFIKNYLPQELKEKFTDEDLYYLLDLIVDYYCTSGCLDCEPDEEGYININQEEIVKYVMAEAEKDNMAKFTEEELLFVVQGEMEYGNSQVEE